VVPHTGSQEIQFGEYALDLRTGELRRNGNLVKLQPQPAKVLTILASRAGEIVTRSELTDQVWGAETYVDFEHGLNYAIRQIRSVLEDDPESPRFLETIPKRGYRFIAEILSQPSRGSIEPPSVQPDLPSVSRNNLLSQGALYLGLVVALAAIVITWYLRSRPSGAPGSGRIHSLAVLPLRNLSNDPEQEYFSDGMTDELITNLAKFGDLRVISHTSVEHYKGTKKTLTQIATELGVDAIIEGTVMRSSDRVRITAQLIDGSSDKHLWADSYERELRDVFSLQDEVALRIAAEVGANLSGRERGQTGIRVASPAAHEAYLRGNFYWNQLTCKGFRQGVDNFQRAISLDPRFAPAYVGLAESYFTLADWGCSSDATLVVKSRDAALKAVELDPNSGEAHAWLGKLAFFYGWDFPEAEKELKRAIELSPNYAEAHTIYAVFLVTTGKRDVGLAEMKRAHDIDPISQLTNVVAIFVSYLAHEYDAALDQGEKTVALYPSSAVGYNWLGSVYEAKGAYDKAAYAYLKSKELGGAPSTELTAFRTAYQDSGMRGFWRKELEAAQERSENPCWIARIYAHLGDKEHTLEFQERSVRQHCSGPHTVVADPVYDIVRNDPGFREVLARIQFQSPLR